MNIAQPHIERMRDERLQLRDRIQKLTQFTRTPTFAELDGARRFLLAEQLEAMTRYDHVLTARLSVEGFEAP